MSLGTPERSDRHRAPCHRDASRARREGHPHFVERDALLQRFEYSVEATWKAVQLHLREVEGIDAGSPKSVARASLQARLLSEEQTREALLLIEDRSLTVHTYEEQLANEIATRVPTHARLLTTWIEAVAARR